MLRFAVPRNSRGSIVAVVVLATSLIGCGPVADKFQTLTLWVANHAGLDRYVYISEGIDGPLNFAYVVPSDELTRKTTTINLGSSEVPDAKGLIVIFDAKCLELGRATVGPGNHALEIRESTFQIVPLSEQGIPTGSAALAVTPIVCAN